MKFVSKEYFACKCIEQVNGCHYLYRQQIKGVIHAVQHKFQISVTNITEADLEEYVAEEIRLCWE